MAKREKQYPDFECTEYDYGNLGHRQYEGSIYATLKFADEIEIGVFFEFKDFLDYHKRKNSPLAKTVESIYSKMKGWGSRYFELIEQIQADDEVDLFELFVQFIEDSEEDIGEKYENRRIRVEEIKRIKAKAAQREKEVVEKMEEMKPAIEKPAEEEEEEEDNEISPYDKDRNKFEETLKNATNDMYEALKVNFFPQMEYFHRRYPTKWKLLKETLELFLVNFEDEMMHEMMPYLDEGEYREFDIKYNSEKADMSDDDEPPTAR